MAENFHDPQSFQPLWQPCSYEGLFRDPNKISKIIGLLGEVCDIVIAGILVKLGLNSKCLSFKQCLFTRNQALRRMGLTKNLYFLVFYKTTFLEMILSKSTDFFK